MVEVMYVADGDEEEVESEEMQELIGNSLPTGAFRRKRRPKSQSCMFPKISSRVGADFQANLDCESSLEEASDDTSECLWLPPKDTTDLDAKVICPTPHVPPSPFAKMK